MDGKPPTVSERARRQPASPIRKLVPHADAAKQRGITVYHLNIGQPDIETPPEFMDVVRRWSKPVLEYGNSKGDARLVASVLRYYRRQLGVELTERQVQVTTGGSEALLFAYLAVTNPGDEILVFEPFYTNYSGFAVMAGVTLVPVPTEGRTGYHLPAAEEIEKRIGPRTRAILVCSPGNPTGTVYTRAEMETIASLCRRHGLFLVSDEPYREFLFEGEYTSALHLAGVEDRVVVVDSTSKRFSACGARVGLLVSRHPDVTDAALRLGQARLSSPTIEMEAAAAAFDLPAEYYRKVADEYRRRRDLLHRRLTGMRGVACEKPEGAFYLMARLPVVDADDFCRWMLTDFHHEKQTVMMAPGEGFYATPGRGRDEVRIAYVLGTEKLDRAMDVLACGLDTYARRAEAGAR